MSQLPDGNKIHTGLSDRSDRVERDSATGFKFHARSAQSDTLPKFRRRHVVQQDNIHPGECDEVADLLDGISLNLDQDIRVLSSQLPDPLLQ